MMPGSATRLLALGAAAVAVAVTAATADARSTMIDDQAPILRRAIAAGLQPSGDNLWQIRGTEAVFGSGREVESVPASALAGLSPAAMASVLRTAMRTAGGRYAVIDDAGVALRGADGDALAAALATLSREKPSWSGGLTLARRVHLYVAPAAGGVLTDPADAGLRAALGRSGGLWLKTAGWTPQQWLTWPAEVTRQVVPQGLDRTRVHVALQGSDQPAVWALARHGSACAVLDNAPAAYRVGNAIEAFAAQYRRSFRPKAPKAPVAGCTAAPVLPGAGATALVASAGRETTGLEIPPGGLVTPPLVAGEPAQVTLQLGDDPLGLAAGLGLAPEAAWQALGVVVQVRGAGVAIDVPVAGDGSAALAFTPTEPGPVSMRVVVGAAGVATALGGPADMVAPLAATAGGGSLLSRVVADPDGWSLTIPLVPTGGSVGDPVLVIVPPFG